MKKKYVTLRDVATLSGVSIATVSFVLNKTKDKRISDQTCARVIEAAQKLNYHPDINAQMLKGKASSIVGLIIPSMRNYFYPELTEGVTDRANELGYNIVLFNTNDDYQKEVFSFDTLISMRAAGIIMVGVVSSDDAREIELIKNTDENGMPVVCVDRYYSSSVVPTVSIDHKMAAYEITKQLIENGHRNIALIMPSTVLHTLKERKEGFEKAMQDSQIDFDEESVFRIDPVGLKDVDLCIDAIFASSKKKSVIFCVSGDLIAIEVIRRLKGKGIKIPQEISVVGFDGICLGEIINPTLSTVAQPIYDIGYEAMSMLHKRISRQKIIHSNLRLPYKVLMRGSTNLIR